MLSSAQTQPKLPGLGGGPMTARVAPFPSQIEGPGGWNSRWISPMTHAEGRSTGRDATFP